MRKLKPVVLAFVGGTELQYFRDVHAGLRNFCAETEGVRLARFRATTRMNQNALNYLAVDGVVGMFPDGPATLSLKGGHLPTVNVSHARRKPVVSSLINDDQAVGEMAARFFVRKGARHLAVLSEKHPWLHLERAVGFRKAVRMEGLDCRHHVLDYPPVPEDGDYTTVFKDLSAQFVAFCRSLPLPCSVFCTTDSLASRFLEVALELGLRIPADLQVLGCDNESSAQADATMPISSIELSGRRIGWMAGETLLRILREQPVPTVSRVPPEHVVERATTGNVENSPLIRKAMTLLRRESRAPVEIGSVAKRLGVSRRSLEVAFRRETGDSPYAYLIRQRLDRACQLLSQTNLRIGEIAEDSGFGDLRIMGTYFRRQLGMSPRKWRKIHFRSIVAPRSGM